MYMIKIMWMVMKYIYLKQLQPVAGRFKNPISKMVKGMRILIVFLCTVSGALKLKALSLSKSELNSWNMNHEPVSRAGLIEPIWGMMQFW